MQTLLHVDLVVESLEESLKFYVDGLGFTVVEDAIIRGAIPRFLSDVRCDSVRMVMLQSARFGAMVELLQFPVEECGDVGTPAHRGNGRPRATAFGPGLSSISFLVENMNDLTTRLASRGVTPLTKPLPVELPRLGSSLVLFVQDPDGNLIELVEAT